MNTMYTLELDHLKIAHRTMWGLGDYATVADTVIPNLGERLVDASGIGRDDRVLDLAAGTGNAALPAARTGARVTALDLSETLLAECDRRAAVEGLPVDCVPGDVESLPFGDAEFDAVISCVGAMFAPNHRRVADELVRVCRPGGTIALANWTPEGLVGRMFGVMKPFAAPPPAGGLPPPMWGSPAHVIDLLAPHVTDLELTHRSYPVVAFANGAHFRDFFKANYGPTIAVYDRLVDRPDAVAELDAALAALYDHHLRDAATGWGYLLVTAKRA